MAGFPEPLVLYTISILVIIGGLGIHCLEGSFRLPKQKKIDCSHEDSTHPFCGSSVFNCIIHIACGKESRNGWSAPWPKDQ